MSKTMNEKFFDQLLWNACVESTNSDGSMNFVINSHCVKYEVTVMFHPATDKPTITEYRMISDRLAAPVEAAQ